MIIQEKEERIREMMKMNGMRMSAYWLSMITYNFILYLATAAVFWLFGAFALNLNFFKFVGPIPMAIVLLGWGVSQIGLSIFISAFINQTSAKR